MKILVTGGAGYIGSHTIIELIEKTGYEIISADNYCNSGESTFDRIENITGKRIRNYPIDLSDDKATAAFFREHSDIEGIIHFAALKAVGESVEKPLLYYRNNINSLLNVLDHTRNSACRYFIFSSSCTVYGNIRQLPVTEETPLSRAESPYGLTKQTGERILEDYIMANSKLKGISLRYFNPVGAHHSGLIGELPCNKPLNLVPVITQTAAGLNELTVYGDDYDTRDGSCIRDYVHVSDIAIAHVQALEYLIVNKRRQTYDVFNLGTGNGVTVLEVIRAFEQATGIKLPYTIGKRRPGDVAAIFSDNSKAFQTLGWKLRSNLENMMSTAWKWQQNL